MKSDTTVGVELEVMTSQHLSPRPSVSCYLRSRHPSNIRSNSTRRAISSTFARSASSLSATSATAPKSRGRLPLNAAAAARTYPDSTPALMKIMSSWHRCRARCSTFVRIFALSTNKHARRIANPSPSANAFCAATQPRRRHDSAYSAFARVSPRLNTARRRRPSPRPSRAAAPSRRTRARPPAPWRGSAPSPPALPRSPRAAWGEVQRRQMELKGVEGGD
eukprot:31126-Pelagococcus_subviridis.AAC.2